MSGSAALLAEAAGHYAAGRLAEAAARASQVLATSPGEATALHILALARLAGGALDEGAALLEQALAARPALDEARLHLALARTAQGRHAAVADLLAPLLARRPELLDAYGPLAAAQWELGARDAAIASYRGLVARRPDDAAALRNLGNALRQTGATAEAATLLARAAALAPGDVAARIGLAEALAAQDRPAEAQAAARAALALRPADHASLFRLAVVLNRAGDLDTAIACLRAADRLHPNDPAILVELANALGRRLDLAGADACYRAVLAVAPDHVPANVNLAVLDLLRGDFAAGWPRYEWRRVLLPQLPQPQDPRAAPWTATADLAGTTVRLVLEQGHGDSLQFIRYAGLLAARGARLRLANPAHAGLAPLFAGLAESVAADEPPAPGEVVVPLLSLPLAFGTDLASIPAAVPYLAAPADRRAAWRARLAGDDRRPRIGVAWFGSATHLNDRLRSIPTAVFRTLLARQDVAFHVLHERLRDGDAALLEGLATVHPAIRDFADTAALTEAMDLVITVDTSVAHLAGALGRPTWVLLPHYPDWRWLLGRDDSPWYPTMRLFRQATVHSDWAGLLARVQGAIDGAFR